MRKVDSLLSEYGESHQNSLNKTIHWICVPSIFFSVVGFLWSIPRGPLASIDSPWATWATVALILVTIYYMSISPQLAIGMVLFALVCLYLCYRIDLYMDVWKVSLVVFVVAWIGQFYGHSVEGKRPSFFKDLQFLLIGPAWLMHFLYKRAGIKY